MNNEIIIQITSGRGPSECCWVVSQVFKRMLDAATDKNIPAKVVQQNMASESETMVSALIKFEGPNAEAFAADWVGTIQWVGQSPYRKFHKRQNWYVGVNRIDQRNLPPWNENEITFQTLRSSGPGGQHVNKTETAVRAIHLPTGTKVTASDNRSQFQNKKIALERLQNKIAQQQMDELLNGEQGQWHLHNILQRGNPVKVFRGKDFVSKTAIIVCLIALIV